MTDQGKKIRLLRYAVQAFFLLLIVFIGYRFSQFVLHFEAPGHPFVQRPPAVDGFLPIAGFMSFKYFVTTGIIEPMHPAALVMFAAICTVSLLLKKGFCGWICPVGTISQYVWMAGEKILGRNYRVEKYTDIGLRSLKYFLMAFFIYVIGISMSRGAAESFFTSDYFKVADIKTMKFFTEMSATTLWFLVIVGGLSLTYKNVWCRYLCPYGALLGLLGRLSPVTVHRDNDKCIHCKACSRNCPGLLDVEKMETVKSPECFGCLTCVSRCPAPGALEVTAGAGMFRRKLSPFVYPVILIALFYMVIGAAMIGNKWHSGIPYEEYQRIIPQSASLDHPR